MKPKKYNINSRSRNPINKQLFLPLGWEYPLCMRKRIACVSPDEEIFP